MSLFFIQDHFPRSEMAVASSHLLRHQITSHNAVFNINHLLFS